MALGFAAARFAPLRPRLIDAEFHRRISGRASRIGRRIAGVADEAAFVVDLPQDERAQIADVPVFAQVLDRMLALAILARAHRLDRDRNADAEIIAVDAVRDGPEARALCRLDDRPAVHAEGCERSR